MRCAAEPAAWARPDYWEYRETCPARTRPTKVLRTILLRVRGRWLIGRRRGLGGRLLIGRILWRKRAAEPGVIFSGIVLWSPARGLLRRCRLLRWLSRELIRRARRDTLAPLWRQRSAENGLAGILSRASARVWLGRCRRRQFLPEDRFVVVVAGHHNVSGIAQSSSFRSGQLPAKCMPIAGAVENSLQKPVDLSSMK